ncbi:phosphoenolpyruvate carboxylase, partial [Robiginitalea sp.]|nr:phosphoenolpyruvate carboxylase [Robiginitalea sp.]
MSQAERLKEFTKSVRNKFNVYNSLFLNLPYTEGENVGIYIPLLFQQCDSGLKAGKNPTEILDDFFAAFTRANTEQQRIDLMFRIIQYVERQVVLYDSVEDAAFPKLHAHSDSLSIRDYFQLAKKNNRWDKVYKKLETFSARLVLTAHPTQFYTPAVLDIIAELRALILDNKIDEIDVTLQQLGLTSLINRKKPTPLDEAKNIIYTLRHVYYQAVGDLYAYIRSSVGSAAFDNPDIIKIGFWPGGDRDGNPFVTAAITRDVADELRTTLMKCYYNDLKLLHKKISFRGVQELLGDLRNKVYVSMFDRQKPLSYAEILEPLNEIRNILVSEYYGLYLKELDLFMDKVRVFKTHFAALDIRQDHRVHQRVVESILMKNGYIQDSISELEPAQLLSLLLHERPPVPLSQLDDPVLQDTVDTISQLKEIQQLNGESGCNRYVISNSEDIYSVLFVLALFRWCGWEDGEITFDIIPLFETMKGMEEAETIMQTLFDTPEYRSHLAARNNVQTIMLGFSDGTKDGGYLKANWSIFKAKET